MTSPTEFPFFVMISSSYGGTPWCGGTILDAYTILTAAHCTNPTHVKAGSTNRMGKDGIIKEVAKCKLHPSAKSTPQGCWNMDLQVCRLKQPIPLGKFLVNYIQLSYILDNYKTKPVQLGTKAEYDKHVKYRSKYSDICQVVGIGRSGKGGKKEYKTKVRPV